MTEIAQTGPHICVCVCTFRRPSLLQQTLEALTKQEGRGRFTFSIVVADNDQGMSARPVVDHCASNWSGQITYCSEPVQNIALARNLALQHATGDYVALIDDDEVPAPDWLMRMLQTCEQLGADGVLGPVLPRFEVRPPSWILKGSFCQRPQYTNWSCARLATSKNWKRISCQGDARTRRKCFRRSFSRRRRGHGFLPQDDRIGAALRVVPGGAGVRSCSRSQVDAQLHVEAGPPPREEHSEAAGSGKVYYRLSSCRPGLPRRHTSHLGVRASQIHEVVHFLLRSRWPSARRTWRQSRKRTRGLT